MDFLKQLHSPLMAYVCGGLLFSLAGIFFKPLVGIFGPLEIAGWRSVVVAVTFLAVRRIAGRSPFSLPISFSKWQWFSAIALAAQTICFSIAILLVSTGDTFLISNAAPIYMVFWQLMFDRRFPSRTELLIVATASIGLLIFFADSLTAPESLANVGGLIAALGAGIAFAGHIYGQGKVGREGTKNGEQLTLGSVLLGSVLTCLIAFPLMWMFSTPRIVEAPVWSLWFLVGLGVFQFAFPMMLWARALPSIPPLFAAFMPTLIAIWAPCWTYLLLSEPFPGVLTLVGAVIVHFAVVIAAIRRVKDV